MRRLANVRVIATRTTSPFHQALDNCVSRPNASQHSAARAMKSKGNATASYDVHREEVASSAARLWRHFATLTLDVPSVAELRTVFSRASEQCFGGSGPASSAFANSNPLSNASVCTADVWRAVDTLREVTTDVLTRLQRICQDDGEDFSPALRADSATCSSGRLNFHAVHRLLRPLTLASAGGHASPAATLRFWCHEVRAARSRCSRSRLRYSHTSADVIDSFHLSAT